MYLERVGGPRLEPVDRTAVDERRELAQSAAERVADWTHREYDVQLVTTPLQPSDDNGSAGHGSRVKWVTWVIASTTCSWSRHRCNPEMTMGHGSRVKWVNKSEWVTSVTGQYS